MKTWHIRNPVMTHGDGPSSHFTRVPNELIRESGLTPRAFQIAVLLRSHTDGFETSKKSIASALGWQRETVGKAMAELVDARWLAIRRVRTASGSRAYEEYHVHTSRAFTAAEMMQFDAAYLPPVASESAGPVNDDNLDPLMLEKSAPPCLSSAQVDVRGADTKEDQLEDKPENEIENQARQADKSPHDQDLWANGKCWICGGAGVYDGIPCTICVAKPTPPPGRSSENASPAEIPASMQDRRSQFSVPRAEARCEACDAPSIPNGRYCFSHLGLVAHRARQTPNRLI